MHGLLASAAVAAAVVLSIGTAGTAVAQTAARFPLDCSKPPIDPQRYICDSPYRAKTKGKVERPFSYIRQDFFLGRGFRNLDDLNAQLIGWLDTVAKAAASATECRPAERRTWH